MHGNIAQIEFNAWHYVDGDLWSSIASTIFARVEARSPLASSRIRALRTMRTGSRPTRVIRVGST